MTSLRKRQRIHENDRGRQIDGHTKRWNQTAAWIHAYIKVHGQFSPAADGVQGRVYLAKRELTDRHRIYVQELSNDGKKTQQESGYFLYGQFRRVWQKEAKTWRSDEGDVFDVIESEERVRGFKRCNVCEWIHENIVKATTVKEREFWRDRQKKHWQDVRMGRQEYGENIQRAVANSVSTIL